jgi:hypothetical protein
VCSLGEAEETDRDDGLRALCDECSIFTGTPGSFDIAVKIHSRERSCENPRCIRLLTQTVFRHCTISGHALVDSVHSVENTCTYKCVFFVD